MKKKSISYHPIFKLGNNNWHYCYAFYDVLMVNGADYSAFIGFGDKEEALDCIEEIKKDLEERTTIDLSQIEFDVERLTTVV